jgi:hypothetical protein
MKKILTLILLLISFESFSQVGISNNISFTPTVTLDVDGAVKTNSGFIANDGGFLTPSIRWNSDANSGFYRPGSGLIGVVSSNVEVVRFTGGGLNIGVLEVNGQGANNQVIVSNHFQQPNEFWFKRAQGNSTTPLLVNNTSVVGSIKSFAYDGTAYRNISNISFEVDGVSGSGDMPGRIVFSTSTDGTTTLTERMRITNSGAVAFGGAANTGTSGQVLRSTGSGSAPIWSTFISPATTVYGSASLSITSATTTWTLVPGLTQTVNIPSASSVIYIAADLGAQTTSASTTGGSTFDLVLQIDGTAVTNGTYKRVSIMNNGGFVQCYGTTAFSIVTTGLSAGNHTFRVVGIYGSGATATVSSSNAQVLQGSLTVMVLR